MCERDEAPLTLEAGIARELWRWHAGSAEERALMCAPQAYLSGAIEWYLCWGFQFENSAPSRWWWCDGVVELSIDGLEGPSFLLTGVAYWARGNSAFFLAPFEVEFHFPNLLANVPARSVIRFGKLGRHGRIQELRHTPHVRQIVEARPARNEDWAFAIELTEPETADSPPTRR
jgi:hypothetical protein